MGFSDISANSSIHSLSSGNSMLFDAISSSNCVIIGELISCDNTLIVIILKNSSAINILILVFLLFIEYVANRKCRSRCYSEILMMANANLNRYFFVQETGSCAQNHRLAGHTNCGSYVFNGLHSQSNFSNRIL